MSLEQLSAALGNPISMGQDPLRFRMVDLVTAVGAAMARYTMDPKSFRQYLKGSRELHQSYLVSLGTDLIAYKYGKRQISGPAAVQTLGMMLARKFGNIAPDIRYRIALLVIGEWTNESCQSCRGTGWVFSLLGVKRECGTCSTAGESSGRRRYDDWERARVLGVRVGKLPEYSGCIMAAEGMIAVARAAATDAAKRAHGI